MNRISLRNFKHTIRDIHNNTENRKFCFIVGAGASFNGGIPTGGQLAQQWFREINERYTLTEIENWVQTEGIDNGDLSVHYGAIYRKRFESDKTLGYEFMVQLMRDAKPTLGHFVLAQVLSKAPGNCVLTTNFDSLIESAIYQFTDKTPLVCGHESLSGYARLSNIHPLIIKIHRDLLLSPKSDLDETSNLDKGWQEPLDSIFNSHIPIVIGYGGNDGSLMDYFEKMKKPSNFFWCVRNGSSPSERVQRLIEKMDGRFIEIEGFDETMKELLWVFDKIGPVEKELAAVTKSRIDSIMKQFEEMERKAENPDFSKLQENKEFSAFEYAAKAENEPDHEKRLKIYLEAVEKFPNTAWLWGEIAYFLHFIKKKYEGLEKYYLTALAIDPENAIYNCNYAIFLSEIKKNYEIAEKYYLKALENDSENPILNGNYATFLKDIKKDFENAEKHYLKALANDSELSHNIGSYANFLEYIKKDYKNAEKYYLKALVIDPDIAFNNGNYANFLMDVKKDNVNAEKYYLKALAIDPEHPNYNGNYARFLNAIKKDYDTAEKFYLKALAFDSEHPNNNGNYANFLKDIRKDYIKAQKYYLKALTVDPKNAINIGNYAIFLSDIKEDYENTEKHYLKALAIDPEHTNNNGNYAGFLLWNNRKAEASKYLDKAFELNNNFKNDLLIELWFYRYAHYSEWHNESENAIESLLKEGVTSPFWNLEKNVETAIAMGHPNPEKLREIAAAITQVR